MYSICGEFIFFFLYLSPRRTDYCDPIGKDYHYYWLAVINMAVVYNVVFVIAKSIFWNLDNR